MIYSERFRNVINLANVARARLKHCGELSEVTLHYKSLKKLLSTRLLIRTQSLKVRSANPGFESPTNVRRTNDLFAHFYSLPLTL